MSAISQLAIFECVEGCGQSVTLFLITSQPGDSAGWSYGIEAFHGTEYMARAKFNHLKSAIAVEQVSTEIIERFSDKLTYYGKNQCSSHWFDVLKTLRKLYV